MTLKDLFHVNREKYREHIAGCDDDELRKREVVKKRKKLSGIFGMLGAFALTGLTGGAAGFLPVFGILHTRSAARKLSVVREEMKKRGLRLHQDTTRDVLLPMATGLIGMGIGLEFPLDHAVHAVTHSGIGDVPQGGLPDGHGIPNSGGNWFQNSNELALDVEVRAGGGAVSEFAMNYGSRKTSATQSGPTDQRLRDKRSKAETDHNFLGKSAPNAKDLQDRILTL
jgi:hypothetical protein